MTSLISWLSPTTMYALGWALIHFLWQGTAIAALAAALMNFCRRPSTRYVIGIGTLALMLAMPFVTLLLSDGPARHSSASISAVRFGSAAISLKTSGLAASATPAANVFIILPLLSAPASPPLDIFPWLVEGWLAGVALLSLRFAGGFLLLEQKHRRESTDPGAPVLALCQEVQRRLGLDRTIRYLECSWLQAPAVIGCIFPVILLPVTALTGLSEEQLRAVIAHELAHVRRWDFLVNLFQILVETLLFYHPAIWWLNKRIRAERELCCDEAAISEYGNRIEYARALALMEEWRSAPALAMAANHGMLSERIFHILRRKPSDAKPRIVGLVGSLFFVATSIVAGNTLFAVALPVPALHASENVRLISSSAGASERTAGQFKAPDIQNVASNSTTATHSNDQIILTSRVLADAKTVRPSSPSLALPGVALPLMAIAAAPAESHSPPDAPMTITSDDRVAAPPAIQPATANASGTPPEVTLPDEYPGPTLKLTAPYGLFEWGVPDPNAYCQKYASEMIVQGANRPLAIDDSAKGRYSFFYWHCMLSNGQTAVDSGLRGPVYRPVGAASPDRPVDVSGTWTISVPRQAERSCAFAQSGNVISGSCTGAEGSGPASGVIDGRQVRWTWRFQGRGREGELDFLGMVGADHALAGQSILIKDRPFGQIKPFTAVLGSAANQIASQK